ncbi:MAG TPA: hypothetical protein VFZ44_17960 [Pyrinomonadaceae bacterium]
MKATLKAMLVLCALAAAAAAQAVGDGAREAPGLEVSGFEWKYEGYAPFEVVRSEKTADSLKTARGTDYVFKYASRLTVRNSGTRAFKSIEWGHVFFDPETGKELKRYRLKSAERVAPGAALTLSKAVFIKPGESTRHLKAGRQRVEVTRVEYEDGAVWRANVSEGRKP